MTARTFKGAVKEFIKANDWLGPEHSPAVVTLTAVAAELDRKLTAPMVAQFNLAFRNLQKQAPNESPDDDPLEQLLRGRDQ